MVFGAGILRAVRNLVRVGSFNRTEQSLRAIHGRKKRRGESRKEVDRKGTNAMIFLLHFALLSLYTRRPAIYPFRDSRL